MVVLGSGKIEPNKFSAKDAPDHAMTMYTGANGTFVFNAGTCIWNLPLSTPPGFQTPINNQGDLGKYTLAYKKEDTRIQRITKNLLERALQMKK